MTLNPTSRVPSDKARHVLVRDLAPLLGKKVRIAGLVAPGADFDAPRITREGTLLGLRGRPGFLWVEVGYSIYGLPGDFEIEVLG